MIGRFFVSSRMRTIRIALLTLVLVLVFMVGVMADSSTTAEAIPSRLVIPSIALDISVVPVALESTVVDNKTYQTWQVADNEVGWNDLSAPLGQIGNTVLTGHSDIKAKVFQNLKNINVGDEIQVIAAGGDSSQVYRYVVTQRLLVQEVGV